MKKNFIILIYLLVSNTLFSQQVKYTRDFGFWGGINVKKKLSKDFEINLEQQLRFYSDAKKFDDYLIDICGKYKMNKNFKLGSNFRYTYNAKRWKEPENNYRYNFALFYRGDIYSRLTFHYRLSYQHEYENLFSQYQSFVQTNTFVGQKEMIVHTLYLSILYLVLLYSLSYIPLFWFSWKIFVF